MADTLAATNLTPDQIRSQFYSEFLNKNRFSKEIGTSANSIIQMDEQLTKKRGDRITFALVNRLTNAGVTGDNVLEGNEEEMKSRSHSVVVEQLRNATRVGAQQLQFSAIDLLRANKEVIMDWRMEDFRDRIIAEFGSINGVGFAAATETQKDAWLVDNADRVLFGATKSNASSNDHSVALATIDNTADKLTTGALSLMKRIAKSASPQIRTVRLLEDERWFVVYANSLSFRDLKTDPTITQAQREALPRSIDNPLFSGGDLTWDGMIIKEIEDFPIVTGVGAGGIDVGRAVLTGAQAIGYGVARRPKEITDTFDYGNKKGIGVATIEGLSKMTFGTGASDTDDQKDHGMVTGWFAAVADS